MIFKPLHPFSPPRGRIDGLIYWGAPIVSLDLVPVGAKVSDKTVWFWDGDDWVQGIFAPPAVGNLGTSYITAGGLDGAGQCTLTAGAHFPNPTGAAGTVALVVCGLNTTGILTVNAVFTVADGTITVTSSDGAADEGHTFVGIVSYGPPD